MPPKKTAKMKSAPKKATRCAGPDFSEPETLSETGDVSDHREEVMTFGPVLGIL